MTHTIELEGLPIIEAPRNHSFEMQERLRHLLLSGAPALPDPRRVGFFEIEDQEQVFYIHVVRGTGKVTLLAVWSREEECEPVPAEALV
jgi:hypothetical protein